VGHAKYYTPEQLAELERREAETGERGMEEAQQEWSELFAEYGRAMESGLEPDRESVKLLARAPPSLSPASRVAIRPWPSLYRRSTRARVRRRC
jgi:hypothetical protein